MRLFSAILQGVSEGDEDGEGDVIVLVVAAA